MRTPARFAIALSLAAGGLAATASPALAAGPEITSVTPETVARDGSVTITGVGCTGVSPVSLNVNDTTGESGQLTLNDVTDTNASGAFTYVYALANHWQGGDEISLSFSCSSTYHQPSASRPDIDGSYVLIQLADPDVEITAPAIARYGVVREVVVTFDSVPGSATLALDGVPLEFKVPGSYVGRYVYDLPASLSIGTHSLTASFDPAVDGSPTVTDTHTVQITRARATATLRSSVRRIRRDRPFAVGVTLNRTGIAPLTGIIAIKDGNRVIKRVRVRAADNGTKRIVIRLPRTGARRITAVYLGNPTLTTARTTAKVVRVRR